MWFVLQAYVEIGRITTSGDITFYSLNDGFTLPSEITAGPDGALWFTEEYGGIGRITTSGVIAEYPAPSGYPAGITAGPDGAIWFTEYAANKIARITTDGSSTTEYALPDTHGHPYAITAGPDGALWFTKDWGGWIGRITTAGVITEYPIGSDFTMGIASGPDGALWLTENLVAETGRIGRAPACGLGFSAAFAGATLTMNFNLGIDTPATFNILLTDASGTSMPFSKPIPAIVPPRAFTLTWNNFPSEGAVTVKPVLTAGPGQAICSEWTTVNTTP